MSEMFFGGKPTKFDVKKLADAFEPLKVGDQVLHDRIEQVLDLPRTSNRYRTVVNKWRKRLAEPETNVVLIAYTDGTGGFFVPTDAQRIDNSVNGIKHGVRKVVRSAKRSAGVTTQDPILQRKNMTLQILTNQIMKEAGAGIRQINNPKVIELNPRRLPPDQSKSHDESDDENKKTGNTK